MSSPFEISFVEGATLDKYVPPEQRALILSEVADHAMTGFVDTLQHGLLAPQLAAGAVLYAGQFILNIANAVHQIHFRLITTRAILAGEVFNEAIQFVDAMKVTGKWEPEVADITRAHLLRQLRKINK